MGSGSSAWVAGGNGTLAASCIRVVGDTTSDSGIGLGPSSVTRGPWIATYMAMVSVSRGGVGRRGLGMPSNCSSDTSLTLAWERPLDLATGVLPLCSGYSGAPVEIEGVGLLCRLAPASGSLTGDTIPRSFLDCSMAIRSCSYSVSSVTFAASLGGLMRDWINSYYTASS